MKKSILDIIEEVTGKINDEIAELDVELEALKVGDKEKSDEESDKKDDADTKDDTDDKDDADKKDEKCDDDKKDDKAEESVVYEHPWDTLIEEGVINEGNKEEYRKFFDAKLKKFGVKSPAELDDNRKKEFFNEIEKDWVKDEK